LRLKTAINPEWSVFLLAKIKPEQKTLKLSIKYHDAMFAKVGFRAGTK
jgi:hypothetical protein